MFPGTKYGMWETKMFITLFLTLNGYGLTEKTDMQIKNYKLRALKKISTRC